MPLPDLPPEIYTEIVSCIQPDDELSARGCKRILKKLALVSRTLHLICTPRLFESVYIDPSVAARESSFIHALCSDDAHARDLAPFVRSVLLYQSGSLAHIRVVQKMPNLQHVRMSYLPITLTIINWYAALPMDGLSLSFDNCHFPQAPLDESLLQTFASVCQKSLKIWDMTDRFQEHSEPLIPLAQLTSLSIKQFSPKISLTHLLESLPALAKFKILRVTSHQLPHLSRNSLSPSCVPNLKHLSCPSDLLSLFVPFHVAKLQSLDVSRGYTVDSNTGFPQTNILLVQRLLSESLEELCVPLPLPNDRFQFASSLLEELPQLRVLGIHSFNLWRIEEEEFVEFIRNVLAASKVKELSLSGIHPSKDYSSFQGDLSWQRRVISHFEADFPQLVRISFTDCSEIMWARDQVEKDWRPFFHSAFQHVSLYQMFLSKERIDYKGHIARQFDLDS